MRQVYKTADGIFISKELIADFEHVEVDTSRPYEIIIRSPLQGRGLVTLLARIDQRREEIRKRCGSLMPLAQLSRK